MKSTGYCDTVTYVKWLSKSSKLAQTVSGDLLVADFHSAILNLATMDAAEAEAKRSEANVTGALQYDVNTSNGVFVTPSDISPEKAEYIMQNSVDAHLKKVQADQIKKYTNAQVSQLLTDDIKKYKGLKVKVTRLDEAQNRFTSLWTDNKTGQLKKGTYKSKSLSGIIDDMSFDYNTIVLKPTLYSRTILPGRKYFLVRVINEQTLVPGVDIKLI
jgi:hypothetical protein